MIGAVDDRGRALLEVEIRRRLDADPVVIAVWIDTAFDGHLVFPLSTIQELGLDSLAESHAILADGSHVTLDTYFCYINWFGTLIPLEVIANDGGFPLLGTALLTQRVLHIDYVRGSLTLD